MTITINTTPGKVGMSGHETRRMPHQYIWSIIKYVVAQLTLLRSMPPVYL